MMPTLFFLALCLGACQGSQAVPVPAASPGPAAASASPAPSPSPASLGPLVGGYTPQDPKGAEAPAMLRRAEALLQAKHPEAGLRLTELVAWQSQVVAGLNHRLELRYVDKRGPGTCTLTIFQSLQGQDELSDSSYQAP